MHLSTLTIVAIVILLIGVGLLGCALLGGGEMLGGFFDRSRPSADKDTKKPD